MLRIGNNTKMPRRFPVALFIAVLAFLLAGCPAPGEGPKAERGYAVANPVISALARYREATGGYPDSLDQLTPKYLPALPEELKPLRIGYEKTDKSYRIHFDYCGPGVNNCTYTPESGWNAYGHY